MDFLYETDFLRICRVCLYITEEVQEFEVAAPFKANLQLRSIYKYPPEEWNSQQQIVEVLKSIVPHLEIKNPENTPPQMICESCLEQLHKTYQFQQMCLSSDRDMQQLLQNYYDAMDVKSIISTDELDEVIEDKLISAPEVEEEEQLGELVDELEEVNIDKVVLESKVKDDVVQSVEAEPLVEVEHLILEDNGEVVYVELVVENKQELKHDLSCDVFTKEKLRDDSELEESLKTYELENSDNFVEEILEYTNEEILQQDTSDYVIENTKNEKVKESHTRPLRKSKRVKECKQNDYSESLTIEEHRSDEDYYEEGELNNPKKKQCPQNSTYKCDECPMTFANQKTLNNHIAKIHDQQKKPALTPTSGSYKCGKCWMNFARKQTLSKHMLLNHNPEHYECDECGKRYDSKRAVHVHKRWYHSSKSGEKHVCEQCNKACDNALLLKAHMRSHKLTHLCSVCGKGFANPSVLKQHLYRHDGKIRFECPECPKKFSNQPDLNAHKHMHNKPKTHACDLCDAIFSFAYQLKMHYMYHDNDKPFKCETCDKGFITATYLRCHMRRHTGETPYECKYCGDKFVMQMQLMKHLRKHLGDNIYRCELCPRRFRLSSERRTHFITHKGDDETTRLANLQLRKEDEERLLKLHRKIVKN